MPTSTNQSSSFFPKPLQTISSSGSRVLLIEDDPGVGKILKEGLKHDAIEIEQVWTGKEAFRYLEDQPVDLIILDLHLPDFNGFEILQRLQDHALWSQIPVVVLTIRNHTSELVRGFELGATDYITKPFDLLELRARVRSVLRGKLLQDQLTRVNVALDKARMQAEISSRLKSEMLAHLSHEIRNPLNGLLAFSNFLMRTPLSDEQKDFLEVVKSSGDTIFGILDQVLDLSKLEGGQVQLRPEPTELGPFLQGIFRQVQLKAEAKGLKFSCHLNSPLPEWVKLDRTRVTQVILNLLINAVKFTVSGSVCLEVSGEHKPNLSSESNSSLLGEWNLQIRVQDTGIGISPNSQQRLFTPFYQVRDQAGEEDSGAGLGLAITKSLVELMGGNIHLTSELGKGSLFQIDLTVPEVEPIKPDLEASPSPSSVKASSSPGASIRYGQAREPGAETRWNPSILLVDDNEINQKVASKLLEQVGYSAQVVSSGIQAIAAVQHKSIDLIFMDISMPQMDGLEATRRIREWERDKGIPENRACTIIAMTANAMVGDRERCLEAGMDHYLAKPVRLNEFKELFATLKNRHLSNASETNLPEKLASQDADTTDNDREILIDLDRFTEVAGNDIQEVKELLSMFISQTEEQLNKLRYFLEAEDLHGARMVAHSCSGSSATCGMRTLVPHLKELELATRRLDLKGSQIAFQNSEFEFGRVRRFITKRYNL